MRYVLRWGLQEFELVPAENLLDPETAGGLVSGDARLASGRYRLLRRPESLPTGTAFAEETRPDPSRPAPSPSPIVKSWIRFRVVEDETGQWISDARLNVTLPDGTKRNLATDNEGWGEIRDLDPGSCDVSAEFRGGTLADTWHFVGVGGRVGDRKASTPGAIRIARIDSHKVRTGESLKSLAEGIGFTWQELSKFNWSTDQPKEIDRFLRMAVGCTVKVGKHDYRFDDGDDPGIVFLPGKWERTGFSTEETHVVRLKRVEYSDREIVLDDPFLGFLAGLDVGVSYADGSKESIRSGADGRIRVKYSRGEFVDLEFTSELRPHRTRVILVPESPTTKAGTWQHLVNLGYVDDPEPPLEAPDDDALARAVEEFQSEHGIEPTGERNGATQSALQENYQASPSWGEREAQVLAAQEEYGENPKEALA